MWAGQAKISERLGLTDGVIYLFFLFITVFVNSIQCYANYLSCLFFLYHWFGLVLLFSVLLI